MRVKKLPLLAAVLALPTSLVFMSNFSGPGAASSGSPLEGGNNCTACHSGTANSGTGKLEIDGLEAYLPGETYTISVRVNDETSSRFGFQAVALGSDNKSVGTIVAGMGTEIYKNDYVQHSQPNADGQFSFEWTAPSTNVGDITFYASGNATNADGSTAGDKVYTGKFTVSNTQTSLAQLPANALQLYPNPSTGNVVLEVNGLEISQIEVFSLSGKSVYYSDVVADKSLSIEGLETGVYFVKASNNNGQIVKKLIVN